MDSVSSASIEIANGNYTTSRPAPSRLQPTSKKPHRAWRNSPPPSPNQPTPPARPTSSQALQPRPPPAVAKRWAWWSPACSRITSTRKISDIIGVIDGIAFQTNILALNAAVEAAAQRTRPRLCGRRQRSTQSAGRSAEAAKEIKPLIGKSVENVESGSEQVAQAGRAMDEIVSSVRRVSDLIGEITASSTEQRDGIAQVNQAVANLDQMTQQNAALVEESTAAAASMRDQAQRLAEVVAVQRGGSTRAAAPAPPSRPGCACRTPAPTPAPAPARGRFGLQWQAAPATLPPNSRTAPQCWAAAPAPAAAQGNDDDEWRAF